MTSENDYDHMEVQQSHSYSLWDASDDELDNDNSSARLFERSRIKALAGAGMVFGVPVVPIGAWRGVVPGATVPAVVADEREAVQKKTFTKWVNLHLACVTCRISDLYLDLRDGRMLIKLLEVLSKEMLVRVPSGRAVRCPAAAGIRPGWGWWRGVPGQGRGYLGVRAGC